MWKPYSKRELNYFLNITISKQKLHVLATSKLPGSLDGAVNYEFSRTAFLIDDNDEELTEVSFHALIKNGKFQDVYAINEDGSRFGELPIERKELLAVLVDPTTPLNGVENVEVNEKLSDTKVIEFCKAFIDHTNLLEEEDINEYDLGPLIKMDATFLTTSKF